MRFSNLALLASLFLGVVPAQAEFVSGGMSGGGGGTVITDPVGEQEVFDALKYARIELLLVFNHQTMMAALPGVSEIPEIANAVLGTQTIMDLIKSVKIAPERAEACHDSAGNETDASIHGRVPNSICISTHRLGQKLTSESLRSQLFALIAHEYSHLLGANEEEAIVLQKRLLPILSRSSANQAVWLLFTARQELNELVHQASSLLEIKDWDSDSKCDIARRLYANHERITKSGFGMDSTHSVFTKKERRKHLAYNAKVQAFFWGICAQSSDPEARDFAKRYAEGFGADSTVSVRDFQLRNGSRNLADDEFGDLLIQKLDSHQTYLSEVNEILNYLRSQLRDLVGTETALPSD